MSKEVQELLKGLKSMKQYCDVHSKLKSDCRKCEYFKICNALENDDLPDEWDLPPLEEEEEV